jgi:uncharacterized protein
MDITPAAPAGRQVVESYGAGRFRVSGVTYQGSIVVTPEATRAWPVTALAQLDLDALCTLMAGPGDIEVMLLGVGARGTEVPAELRLRLIGKSIEAMDSGAAARTYNVLMLEGRRVAAALIAVD